MARKVFILTGSGNYGRYTTADTVNTATDPSILNSGAIGIYGMVDNDADTAGNSNKPALLCNAAGTPAAGVIKATTFLTGGGRLIQFAQGGTNGFPVMSGYFNVRGIKSIRKQSYVSGIKQVTFVGYNGTSGSLSLPTIAQNSEVGLLAVASEATQDDQIPEREDYGVGLLTASESAYDILSSVANKINNASNKTQTGQLVSNATTLTDFTGTATAIKFTKGSTTAAFVIEDATGWIASTGTVAAADVIQVPHENLISFSFTALILGTAAGRHLVTINGTTYNVADAGSAAQNAQAIADAINAGSQAKASVATAVVTVILNAATYAAKVTVTSSVDDSTFLAVTLTNITTTGELVPTIYKASAAVAAAASFELDRAFTGETCYARGGVTAAIHTGIATVITEYGLKIICDTIGTVYGYAAQMNLQYATMTYSVAGTYGFGSGASVVQLEQAELAYRGQFDSIDVRMKQIPKFADANTSYDIYNFTVENSTTDSGANNNKEALNEIVVCIPIYLTNSTKVPQENFEEVFDDLAVTLRIPCNFLD